MSDLLIQHARWQGVLVTPDDRHLETGAKCGCTCIGCGEPLILRRGVKKRWHFAHRAKTFCGGETYIHKVVKAWVAEKLIGQTIPLPPHPELNSPQGFRVEKGWQEEHSKETKRRYDVVLEGLFLYEKAEQETRGRLIFEVYYSNTKDDKFKLQTQKEANHILEVNAKKFYEDEWENLTAERLIENSQWVWFSDQQIEERRRIEGQNWFDCRQYTGNGLPDEIIQTWIAEKLIGEVIPLPPHPELDSPQGFRVEKGWQKRRSQRTDIKYDVVLQGVFVYGDSQKDKKGHLIFEVVNCRNLWDEDYKLQTQKEGLYILEVGVDEFYETGLETPTVERLIESSCWVWFTDEQNKLKKDNLTV